MLPFYPSGAAAGIAVAAALAALRTPRAGLALALAGPLLAAAGLLALVPLAVARSRGAARRAAQALAAVAAAAVAAGLRGAELPFGQGAASTLDVAGADSAATVMTALLDAVPAGLALAAVALGSIAVALPYARTPWRIAGLGAGALAAMLAAVPASPALPLVAAVWLTCAALALESEH